jgi:DNA topoisomerase-1
VAKSSLVAPHVAAREAGLRYVSDDHQGIRRLRRGRGFVYVLGDSIVRDRATLSRIRRLAIPPAWTDVWICAQENGHIQATGRDARGRKQYRYHPEWRRTRDEAKYGRMMAFGRALPKLRARVARDLRRKGLPREKVLAAIVRLLDATFMRVGNDEYRRHNGSHGLTTLHDKHATVRGGDITFEFRGKAGKMHTIGLRDAGLARIVKHCQELPGQDLFQYLDEAGKVRDVTSGDVNDYIREISGEAFTAKDFRTWAGTVLAAVALAAVEDEGKPTKKNVVRAIESVAERLGNTPAVCRKCYVHPEVLESYLDGTFAEIAAREAKKARGLDKDERMVLQLLRARLRRRQAL